MIRTRTRRGPARPHGVAPSGRAADGSCPPLAGPGPVIAAPPPARVRVTVARDWHWPPCHRGTVRAGRATVPGATRDGHRHGRAGGFKYRAAALSLAPCDRTSFCRWAIYVTCLPAWVGCLVKVPSTGRTTCFASAGYPPLPLDRDYEARVDPDITGTGTGPTTSESTPPAHATRATRPAPYLSYPMGD